MPPADDLQGCRVLVTRPAAQAEALCEGITEAGGIAIRLPALAIEAVDDPPSQQRCQSATDYDWLIFISRNAVEQARACLPRPLSATVKVAAIGRATAAALAATGIHVALVAEGPGTSESLLTERCLADMDGRRVLILRGEGGRERLAEALCERGAQVDHAELYRRVRADTPAGELSRLLDAGIDLLTVASGETLDNLMAMAAEEHCDLTPLPLLVMSERLAALARERGFTDTVIIATKPSDNGMVEAISQWHKAKTE
ncbi:uroporphyrinogen-III synthase [Sulfuriflexus mobilis]|uniref:uroporphyrinogen-III synthase n=1 Tax=Sulfuriflexus mobilis TaxID=1811807 RepID=UPI000F81D1D0|nr:uroporphyrinogen-III synthase [Sulfuriflexus mobilis]